VIQLKSGYFFLRTSCYITFFGHSRQLKTRKKKIFKFIVIKLGLVFMLVAISSFSNRKKFLLEKVSKQQVIKTRRPHEEVP